MRAAAGGRGRGACRPACVGNDGEFSLYTRVSSPPTPVGRGGRLDPAAHKGRPECAKEDDPRRPHTPKPRLLLTPTPYGGNGVGEPRPDGTPRHASRLEWFSTPTPAAP